jgi:hypothetical protein
MKKEIIREMISGMETDLIVEYIFELRETIAELSQPMSCEGCENKDIDPHLADCLECRRGAKDNYTPKQRQPQLCRGCINLERKFADECRNCSRHLSIGDNYTPKQSDNDVCPHDSGNINYCMTICKKYKGQGADPDGNRYIKCAYQNEV